MFGTIILDENVRKECWGELSGRGNKWELCSGNVRGNVQRWVNLRLLMQDYKSLCATVMICITLVNTHTHTCALQLLTSYTISSASSANKNNIVKTFRSRFVCCHFRSWLITMRATAMKTQMPEAALVKYIHYVLVTAYILNVRLC